MGNQVRRKKGSKKIRQKSRNLRTGKYLRQFSRTVSRTGIWRGKKIV